MAALCIVSNTNQVFSYNSTKKDCHTIVKYVGFRVAKDESFILDASNLTLDTFVTN